MTAGQSAHLEADRQIALADAYTRQAEVSRTNAAQYFAASVSEERTPQQLAPLTAHGYYLLPDWQWPGSRRAQVAGRVQWHPSGRQARAGAARLSSTNMHARIDRTTVESTA